jgi:hypothetical protein
MLNRVPLRRFGAAEEVAGQVLRRDGGLTAY